MQVEGLAGVIAEYIDQRRLQKLEPLEKELEKSLKSVDDESEKSRITTEYASEIQRINWPSRGTCRY
jgi:CRISPR-associated protein Csy1